MDRIRRDFKRVSKINNAIKQHGRETATESALQRIPIWMHAVYKIFIILQLFQIFNATMMQIAKDFADFNRDLPTST